jgi:hypothetical protein
VDLYAGLVSEDALDLAFVHAPLSVGLDEQGFEDGAGGVEPCVAEPGGERVRDVDRHLHGVSVAPVAVGKKAIRVVTPAASLRPSAER